MAQSELSPYSAPEAASGADIGGWGGLELPWPKPMEDPAEAGRSQRLGDNPMTQAIRSLRVVTNRPVPQVGKRASTMVAIGRVLTDWRTAERELSGLAESSPNWSRLHTRLGGLRATYHRLFSDRRDDQPGP